MGVQSPRSVRSAAQPCAGHPVDTGLTVRRPAQGRRGQLNSGHPRGAVRDASEPMVRLAPTPPCAQDHPWDKPSATPETDPCGNNISSLGPLSSRLYARMPQGGAAVRKAVASARRVRFPGAQRRPSPPAARRPDFHSGKRGSTPRWDTPCPGPPMARRPGSQPGNRSSILRRGTQSRTNRLMSRWDSGETARPLRGRGRGRDGRVEQSMLRPAAPRTDRRRAGADRSSSVKRSVAGSSPAVPEGRSSVGRACVSVSNAHARRPHSSASRRGSVTG